jgi:hypothetical protein
MARQAARYCVVVTYRFRHVAPLGAPSRRRYGAGPRFLTPPFRAAFDSELRPLLGGLRFRASGKPSGLAVSQLLAGGHNAPGRSPGAARELGGAFIPRPRAPLLAPLNDAS